MSEKNGPIAESCPMRYYKSFASYEIPFRPDDPIEYAEAEGLRSFYAARHDAVGRVIRFDKIQLVRVGTTEREIDIGAAAGSNVYFEATRNDAGEAIVSKPIDFRQTEYRDEYFVGVVDSSGRKCRASLFRKEIAFSDEYEYWPNGRLRTRTMSGNGKPRTVAHYDREGARVNDSALDKNDAAVPLIDSALSESSI